ncbi:glutamate racemase [Rhizobiales bacterium GAS191]|nr:glutamate racemase [Rhizobiales bacterium GAS191]
MGAANPLVLIFDSGIGGLTVFREIAKLRPDARYAYIADDARFPYGDLADEEMIARVCELVGTAIGRERPDCVVIACNTASTLVLPHLRAAYAMPFVGTVPAVKPAAALSRTQRISVLATPGTVRRDYTRELVASFAEGCRVELVGSAKLAALAEDELSGRPAPDAEILAEIAPCFRDDGGALTDVVVLGCTHYALLSARLTKLAPWPVTWLDPAPAIARRAAALLGNLPQPVAEARLDAAIAFTSDRKPAAALVAALRSAGLEMRNQQAAVAF